MPVDGIHHWRAYSITSDPGRADGCISVTPKLVESGKVSPYLLRVARPGVIVRLGGVEGAFTLPDPLPAKLLFISAGSGITPIMSMLRSIDSGEGITDAVHLHSARTADDVIFGAQLRDIARRNPGFGWTSDTRLRAAGSPRLISTGCVPIGASARPSFPGRPRCWRR